MQKVLCILLILIIALFGLVGCNSNEDSKADNSSTASNTESETGNSMPKFPFDEPIELPMDWWDEEEKEAAEKAEKNNSTQNSANDGDIQTQNNEITLPTDEW